MGAKPSYSTPLPVVQPDWSPVATVRCDYRSAGRREDGKYVEHDTVPHLCSLSLIYPFKKAKIYFTYA
jgi:hypothetical protein